MSRRPRIHDLYERPLDGAAIEAASFAAIDREAKASTHSVEEWDIVRRLIHASADLSLGGLVRFSADAVSSGCSALLAGQRLVVDSKMIRAGLSLERLRRAFPGYEEASVLCHVSDADVVASAGSSGLPRAVFAVRQARPALDGGIVLFGNSPVGLLELNRMIIEEGVRPALVVGMPVGFVHVEESKEELMSLQVPWIVVTGRRGGSPLAVAAVHALSGLAARLRAPEAELGGVVSESAEAIILLGHGSRVPQAGDAMYRAAARLKTRYGHSRVEVCFMSRLGPHYPETFARSVDEGARTVIVIPYFLHGGLHVELDIPEMLRENARPRPEVRVVLGDRLGYEDVLVDIVQQRISAARSLPDVRDLVLPPHDRFPLPAGQDEFVPMSPEAAARWRAGTASGEHHGES